MSGMTAKEALRNYIEGLSEDDAADLLLWIEDNGILPPLTPEQIERAERGVLQLDDGQRISQGTVEKQFGVTG